MFDSDRLPGFQGEPHKTFGKFADAIKFLDFGAV
jgi:hypothetical protein